jgi:hypothetical protein
MSGLLTQIIASVIAGVIITIFTRWYNRVKIGRISRQRLSRNALNSEKNTLVAVTTRVFAFKMSDLLLRVLYHKLTQCQHLVIESYNYSQKCFFSCNENLM